MSQVDVTQVDIKAGERRDGNKCPVALALRRATGCKWHVGRYSMEELEYPVDAIRKREFRSIPNSQEVFRFTDAFDDGLPVAPFSFELPDAE